MFAALQTCGPAGFTPGEAKPFTGIVDSSVTERPRTRHPRRVGNCAGLPASVKCDVGRRKGYDRILKLTESPRQDIFASEGIVFASRIEGDTRSFCLGVNT